MTFKNLFLIPIICLSFFGMDAQDKKPNPLKTKSVSVFKNGTSFFIKDGKVKTEDGAYVMTEHIPRALFGTLWFHSPDEQLKHVSSYMDQVEDKTEVVANSWVDLLQANIGKKIKLHIGKDEVYDGKVEEVVMKNAKGEEKRFINNTIIVFKTGTQWLSITPGEIRRVEFMEKPNQVLERETTSKKNVVRVDFLSKKLEQPLELMYLQQGLNWVPTYQLELLSDTEANLTLRAEVSNNAEDIENTDVNFVVGIPNFQHANRLSALVDFLGQIYPGGNQAMFNNFSNANRAQTLSYDIDDASFSGTPMSNNVDGTSNEDLYFYRVKNLTLKNGGRGRYHIFNEKIKIAHIYECNLQANGTHRNYYQTNFLFTPDNQNPVFHSVKVNNSLAYPWTTGSCMVINRADGTAKPLSQDKLHYTPIKGHGYVKITETPDIKVKQAEKEIDRELGTKKIKNGNSTTFYDRVTVEGQIKVKSYKTKKVDLNIKRAITGELLQSDVKWLKAKRVNRSGSFNDITDVCWETSIEGGKELVITYTYKVYVPQ